MLLLIANPWAIVFLIVLLLVIGYTLYMLIHFLQNNAVKKTVFEIQQEKETEVKEHQ